MATTVDLAALMQGPPGDKQAIAAALEEGRRRTWLLVEGLPEDLLAQAACPYLSPPNWDLGHIGNFEELWLVQRLLDCQELHAGYNGIYNAFEHPRQERPGLPLLDRQGVRTYQDTVRQRALEVLEACKFDSRLTRDGFVHWMIVLHEHQHQETILQSLQMTGPRYKPPARRRLPEPDPAQPGWVRIPAGEFWMGTEPGPGAYDNESPPHRVQVDEFEIARFPVTCGQYLHFIEDGGYEPKWWSPRGRQWLEETAHHAPLYWDHDGTWWRTAMGRRQAISELQDEILCHVTYFEAEAYAAWAGARLPTEAEWEKACRGEGARNPWGDGPATPGHANIDQLGLQPSCIGAYPGQGPQHMIGDVWEWTSSDWQPYPGFEWFPYPEYSQAFFGGDYRVLRGGSWATRAGCATGTFRNWDHPYRRQIFSGIRLARDP